MLFPLRWPQAASANAQSANPGDVTSNTGPNGYVPSTCQKHNYRSEDWLNTGITDDGWNPPYMALEDLYHITLDDFYNDVGSPCSQYDQYFQNAGFKYSVDPVILAVLAMQESSCNANAGGPTPGLMQVSCDNYPSGQCMDSIQDNIDAGMNYLASRLNSTGGNAIEAFGSYNGWFTANSGLNDNKGLTVGYPCSSEGQSNCIPQNLDYLQSGADWLVDGFGCLR